ncbi:MAG: carbon-nitrogen hydrolase family protein [Planctomycetes bacterium]|nr:carbon-nitrogen hydrolase family protein [Planctomycetota bacterium]
MFRVGVCQTCSSGSVEVNLAASEAFVRDATACGAELVCLPEYFTFYGAESDWKDVADNYSSVILDRFSRLAKELKVYLSLGSVLTPGEGSEKVYNRSHLLAPDGNLIAFYDKRNLFDVDLPDRRYRESDWLLPGEDMVTCDVNAWNLGMSICFDLRFSSHYTALAAMGADLIIVPAAFSAITGEVHWEPMLRARAIETQSYIIAAAQTGECAGKLCYGHSMVVNPWGEVLVDAGIDTGVVFADLDHALVDQVRSRIPMGYYNG